LGEVVDALEDAVKDATEDDADEEDILRMSCSRRR
jgi:hypothetical protein